MDPFTDGTWERIIRRADIIRARRAWLASWNLVAKVAERRNPQLMRDWAKAQILHTHGCRALNLISAREFSASIDGLKSALAVALLDG